MDHEGCAFSLVSCRPAEVQRCRDRPHWEVSDNWTACFITHATATTPNTRPPVTAPIIPTTMKKMLNGSGNRSDTETVKSPMTIAPTPESAINGLLNLSAMRSQPPRTHHSEKPSRPRRLATKLHRLCPDASKNPRRPPARTPSEEVVAAHTVGRERIGPVNVSTRSAIRTGSRV